MKAKIIAVLVFFSVIIYAQNAYNDSVNVTDGIVQSINIDKDGAVVFSLIRNYFSSSVVKYKDNEWTEWNFTEMLNSDFFWISTFIDHNNNYLAFHNNSLFKYDGSQWNAIKLFSAGFVKYSNIIEDNRNNIWVSNYYPSQLFSIIDTNVTDYTSQIPFNGEAGRMFAHGDSLWICSSEGLVLYNGNQFFTFDASNSNLPSQNVYSFFIDSQNRKWIGSMNKGLIQWVDDSTFIEYSASNTDLKSNFINDIDEDSKGTLWFATDSGFAKLENGIVTRQPAILENNSIVALKVDESDNIWLGTYGRGLYYFDHNAFNRITDLNESDKVELNYSLSQNYPNPFNPNTIIKFQVPSSKFVKLQIHDLLGREVQTLVNAPMSAGEHEVTFNGSNLPSGVYIITMEAGNYRHSIKSLLLK
ncbi:MAG: two-component regulator propeller domain-containing protein [Bacteroidota bacterium]